MQNYEIKEKRLFIEDLELDLNISAPFDQLLLPKNWREMKKQDFFKIEYFSSNKKNIRFVYMQKNNQMHGEALLFYPDQTLQAHMFYHENKLHGPSIFYCKNKKILSKTWFVNGKKQGRAIKYYPSSKKVYSIERFYDDQFHESQEYFYEDGGKKTILNYVHGKLKGTCYLYFPNGKLKRKIHFAKGKREGLDQIFNEKEELISEERYSQNRLLAKEESFPNG